MVETEREAGRPDRPEKKAEQAESLRQQSIADHAQRAKAWWDTGRAYYIVTLNLGSTTASWWSGTQGSEEGDDVSGVLQQVETIGWHLYHIGYVYQPKQDRAGALPNSRVMAGTIVGIYTFSREHQGLERLL